ncbi:MAG: amino acid permease, partial [Gemmatimonadaceae bacterium]|nr:amino acid permease [Gemmatimonadaceae bacterium]
MAGIGLVGVVALAVGNMVGTSIWTLPASLAEVAGPLAVVAWLVTAGGYWFVARSYARLGARWPITGGPYVFAREAFGERVAFVVVWSYWLSATLGNAAIVTGVIGYAAGIVPALDGAPVAQFIAAQVLLWGLCGLNVLGVRHSARLGIALMVVTIAALVGTAAAALPQVAVAHFTPFAPHGWGALAPACALIVWAYSGVESATVPAGEVRGGGATIARGTMLGYWIATLTYLAAAVAVTGTIATAELAATARPLALVAERTVGAWAGVAVGLAALGSNVATLNGWILLAGRIPVQAAADGLVPPALARLHPRTGTPATALVIG